MKTRLRGFVGTLLLCAAGCAGTQPALPLDDTQQDVLYYQNGFTRFRIERIQNSSRSVAKMFYRSGEPLYYLELTNDDPHGSYRRWYANGQLKERGQYIDGEPTGVWEVFDSNGLRRGHGHLGKPVPVAGSFAFSDPQNPLSMGLPTMAFFEKGEDWSSD